MAAKTVSEVITDLRHVLNDMTEGSYTDNDLLYCVNRAIRQVEILSDCHKVWETITLVQGQCDYDVSPIHRVLIATYNTTPLTRERDNEFSGDAAYLPSETGAPEKFWNSTANTLTIYPTPNAAAAGQLVKVYGAATTGVYATGDSILSIPECYVDTALIDWAEGEARKMRATNPLNVNMVLGLLSSSQAVASRIRDAGR